MAENFLLITLLALNTMVPNCMNEEQQPREWKSKANAEYQKVIASIISLSTATLVLPTLFLKDFVGLGPSTSLRSSLSCQVYIAWALLFVAIACCLVYYYISAKWLKQAYGGVVKYSEQKIEKFLDISFWVAGGTFIFGLLFLLVFMVSYVPKNKGKEEVLYRVVVKPITATEFQRKPPLNFIEISEIKSTCWPLAPPQSSSLQVIGTHSILDVPFPDFRVEVERVLEAEPNKQGR